MKKLIFAFLLIHSCSLVAAGWEEVPGLTGTEANHYIDRNRIKKIGVNQASLWLLLDRKAPTIYEGQTAWSSASNLEFDCKSQKYRVGITYYYSKPMGEGTTIGSLSVPAVFQPPAPNSPPELYMMIACK
jgi:hypothetical protein